MKIIFAVCIVCLACSLYSADLVQVKEHNLNNGLRVLFVEDHNTPLVVCRLYYKVGSVCENIGKTGLSHMLEHMMFKGTKKVGVSDFAKEQAYTPAIDSLFLLADAARDQDDTVHMALYKKEAEALVEKQRQCIKNNELWSLYQKEGGTNLNAYTSNLMTAYIVTLPSNKIELFMWLESDRMANPVMREFYTERDVVMEERRLRTDDNPTSLVHEALNSAMFNLAMIFRRLVIGPCRALGGLLTSWRTPSMRYRTLIELAEGSTWMSLARRRTASLRMESTSWIIGSSAPPGAAPADGVGAIAGVGEAGRTGAGCAFGRGGGGVGGIGRAGVGGAAMGGCPTPRSGCTGGLGAEAAGGTPGSVNFGTTSPPGCPPLCGGRGGAGTDGEVCDAGFA